MVKVNVRPFWRHCQGSGQGDWLAVPPVGSPAGLRQPLSTEHHGPALAAYSRGSKCWLRAEDQRPLGPATRLLGPAAHPPPWEGRCHLRPRPSPCSHALEVQKPRPLRATQSLLSKAGPRSPPSSSSSRAGMGGPCSHPPNLALHARGFPTPTPLTPPTGTATGLVARLGPAPSAACGPGHRGWGAQWGPPPHFQTSKPSCRNRARASQAASGAGAGQVQGHVQLRSQPRSSPHWPAEVPSRGESPGGQRPPTNLPRAAH